MTILTLLWCAIKGLCRAPNRIRKFGVLLLAVMFLYTAAHVLSGQFEHVALSFTIRWVWIPLSVLFLICAYGEPMIRRSFARFFKDIKHRGYDGRIPEYIKTIPHNRYIEIIRFKSRIPLEDWEKIKPKFETFLNLDIKKFDNLGDKTMMNVHVIVEEIPTVIEWRDEFAVDGRRFAIGESYEGQAIWDLTQAAHGLVAGASGAGKTALIRSIVHQAAGKCNPNSPMYGDRNSRFQLSVIDMKGGGDYSNVEKYRDIEKSQNNSIIVSEPEQARDLLRCLTVEVKTRAAKFKELGVENIEAYLNHVPEQPHMRPWLVVIDELAELVDVKPKNKDEKQLYEEIDSYLRTLARTSRSTGISLLFGIIRPSADILDGQVKNSILWRACGYFADPAASRIVLDNSRATELPADIKGRFIIGENEVQAYYMPIPKGRKE